MADSLILAIGEAIATRSRRAHRWYGDCHGSCRQPIFMPGAAKITRTHRTTRREETTNQRDSCPDHESRGWVQPKSGCPSTSQP
ncbi:hypothetical protein BT93_I0868 [Corymbia citriodora subsp. variegata]|nr:hypothetical protein BT93_I0868 [Corymbia citriodora subsp. variegata]